MNAIHIAYLHQVDKSDYGVSFPDFPGCITAGKSRDEARRLAVEALSLHVRGMVEDGEAMPEPSLLSELAADLAMQGAVALHVQLETPERTVRITGRKRAC